MTIWESVKIYLKARIAIGLVKFILALITLGLLIMIFGCQASAPKFHAGDMVKVVNDDFYTGCSGIVTNLYPTDERTYRIQNVRCGVLEYNFIVVKEEHLVMDTLTFIVPSK